MINFSEHDTISQCFSNNEFNIFSRNIKFMSNILKWDSAVCNWNSSQSDSDDDLIESENKIVKFVFLEDFFVLFNDIMEMFKFSF